MKRNYFLWLEALHQLRHNKEETNSLQYFSESEWKQTRKSLNDKKLAATQNMSNTARRAKQHIPGPQPPVHNMQTVSNIVKGDLELL